MSNYVFQMIVSNAAICLGLALIALIAGRAFKRPSITHLLWLLVLMKLLTPPVVNISTFPVPWMTATDSPAAFEAQQDMGNISLLGSPESERASLEDGSDAAIQWKYLLFLAWLLGSGIVFAWSLSQAYRFHRLLQKESESGNPEIREMAAEAASCLGLKKIPEIRTVSARVSPMVWWIGGKVKVVVPDVLLERIEAQELRWILAHELAHVRRKDFYVRWVEWLTCVLFWWYPVAWWARRNLRINEELCCDELVLSCLKAQPVTYGESLLKTVEILSGSEHFEPMLASGINSGELLKKRIRVILSNTWKDANLRRMRTCTLLGALIVLPLGLTSAQSGNQDRVQALPEEATPTNVIPDGMRAVAIKVDRITNALSIVPGARVDVIRTGRYPNENKRAFFRFVLGNIRVLTSGQHVERYSDGRSQDVWVVTLLVTPEQAQKLLLAGADSFRLVVRNSLDREDSGELRPNLLPKQGSNNPTFVPVPKQGSNGPPSAIPDGMRAVSIKFDSIIGDADSVLPGTRVNVIRKDLQPSGGNSDDSRIIFENVQVLTAGQFVEQNSDGQSQNVRVVTLLVTPEQAQKLVKAASNRIQLEVHN